MHGAWCVCVLTATQHDVASDAVTHSLFVNGPPVGNCSASPSEGIRDVTMFTVSCDNVTDADTPMVYNLHISSIMG